MSFVARASCTVVHIIAEHVSVPERLDRASAKLAQRALRLYQKALSRHTGRQCLFEPSCSHRAIAAFHEHGFRQGIRETSTQLRRCGGTYSTCTDCFGRITLITSDGSRFSASELSAVLVSGRLRR
ncbi:membrane protein insertion efficiency factor YidD [Belnapia rosea]|uniref:membrane protein insertion efficiency factor YidD n=1 Tax=Belnapia rosea TaxID=938405 RepID=UPI000B847A23